MGKHCEGKDYRKDEARGICLMKPDTAVMGIEASERFCRLISCRREKEDVSPLVDKVSKPGTEMLTASVVLL